MKHIALIIGFLLTTSCFAQKISKLYAEANESVVLIKTLRLDFLGTGDLKSMVSRDGVGSGFVISEDGEIITAAHVVHTADHLLVVFSDGEEVPAKVMYSYPFADLALIKLSRPKSTPLTLVKMADSDKVKIGNQIFVIGAPFGLGHSLSVGYISGRYGDESDASGLMTMELFQTDAAINEGSSGAPMFNMQGEVIGIASFILSYSKGFEGLSFAVTSNSAQRLLEEQNAVWTGLDIYVVTGFLAEILNLPQSSGVMVRNVATNSLGASMGLKGGYYRMIIEGEDIIVGGDIILEIENIALTNGDNLVSAWKTMQELKAGDSLRFKILRKGKIMELRGTIP